MTLQVRPQPLGDSAVTLTLGDTRSKEVLARAHALARALTSRRIEHVHDIVPSYLAVTVFYDALSATYEDMKRSLLAAVDAATDASGVRNDREHVISVHYDGEDLAFVADRSKMSVDEVIRAHTSVTYTVDLLGFVPGWAYLSELPASLQLQRRDQPRPRVAAGSVAIAGSHTGVYPLDTPGGWHILGRTTVVMFDAAASPPALLQPGDSVRFVAT